MSLSLVSSAHLWKLIKQFPNTFIIHHWFPPTLSCSALCGNGFLYKSGNGKKRKVSIPWNYIDSGNSTENNFFFCFQRNRRSSSKSRTSGGSCLETDQSFIFFANSPFCNSKHCSLQSRSFRVKGWRSFPIKVFKTEVAEEPANSFHYSFTLICLMAFDQSSKPIQAEECQVRSSISFFRPFCKKVTTCGNYIFKVYYQLADLHPFCITLTRYFWTPMQTKYSSSKNKNNKKLFLLRSKEQRKQFATFL